MTEQISKQAKNTINSRENIEKVVDRVITTEFKNKELIRNLNKEFESKGLNPMVNKGVFETTRKYKDLTDNEKIAFVKGSYEILNWEALKPNVLFSNGQLVDYKGFFNTNVERNLKEVVLDDITQIDDFNLIGTVSYKKISLFMDNVLWRYNPKTQRGSKIKKLGTKGDDVRDIDINWSHVYDIAELMLANEFDQNQIILNIRLEEDNTPDYTFQPEFRNFGRLTVRPHYEVEADNFTVIDILDGFHRILGVVEAVKQYKAKHNGEWLTGSLDVRIVLRDLAGAVRIIDQIFKRSDTDKSFLNAIKVDKYSKFIDMLSDRSEILKNQIETSFEECRIEKVLTYKSILKDTIRNCTNIQVTSVSVVNNISNKMSQCIDTIIKMTKETYFNNDLEKMKENSFLLDCNIFVGYIAMSNTIIERGTFYDYSSLCERLYRLKEEDVKELGLNNKSCNYKNVYSYFENLVNEVIQVA